MESGVSKPQRLMSIDALRGFDMFLIIFADRFFIRLGRAADTPVTDFLATQFDHPEWLGFHIYDIIMPLFLFVVGAVIPFSLKRRLDEGHSKSFLYRHLLKRVVVLFILGAICQGHLLALDINELHLFSNTLQAIAVGYLFSSMAYIHLNKKGRYILFAALLVVYALLLAIPGIPGNGPSEMLPDKSFALYVDHLILGRFDDGTQYTWILSGLGFTATVLSGVFAGELIRSSRSKEKIALYLLVTGVVTLALGLIWGIWHPIIKKLWTSSFVLFMAGLCFILMAGFYWIIDVKGYRKWAYPFKVIGMNAISVYVASHVISFPKIADFVLFGFKQYLGDYYEVLTTIGGFGIMYLILWYMYKNRTFIKV
jgi:predicted acyltransferase